MLCFFNSDIMPNRSKSNDAPEIKLKCLFWYILEKALSEQFLLPTGSSRLPSGISHLKTIFFAAPDKDLFSSCKYPCITKNTPLKRRWVCTCLQQCFAKSACWYSHEKGWRLYTTSCERQYLHSTFPLFHAKIYSPLKRYTFLYHCFAKAILSFFLSLFLLLDHIPWLSKQGKSTRNLSHCTWATIILLISISRKYTQTIYNTVPCSLLYHLFQFIKWKQ